MQHNTIKKALILASLTASHSSLAVSNSVHDTSMLNNQSLLFQGGICYFFINHKQIKRK